MLEGNITIPYKWTTGPVIGRFLAGLKRGRIVAGKCSGCGRVYVPPPDVCGACFRALSDFLELSGHGTVIATSTVYRSMPWSPVQAPYSLAMIKLDGADTNLIHLISPGLKPGDRVRAHFKQQRVGSILDIERFVSESEKAETMPAHPSSADPLEGILAAEDFFKLLPSAFRRGQLDRTLSFYFSIDEKQWTVTVGPDLCHVQEGKASERADCYVKTSEQIFIGRVRGQYQPSLADLLSGKIKSNRPDLLRDFMKAFGFEL
jgi:uncharacterized OB-fold protein